MSLIMDPIPPFSHSSPASASQHHLRPLTSSSQNSNIIATNSTSATPHTATSLNRYPPTFSVPSQQQQPHRGVTKRTQSHSQSSSTLPSQQGRIDSLLPDQIREQLPLSPGRSVQTAWSSPKSSPRSHPFFEPTARHSSTSSASTNWAAPTPPHSESGAASISVDNQPTTTAHFTPSTRPASMAVHYGIQQSYGPLGIDEATLQSHSYSFDQAYRQPMQQHAPTHSYDFSQADNFAVNAVRTSSPMPMPQQYSYDFDVPRAHAHAIMQRPLPTSTLESSPPNYSTTSSSGIYDTSLYAHTMPGVQQMAAPVPSSYTYAQQPMYNMPSAQSLPRSMSGSISSNSSFKATQQKPKPQCWEHGCNGRRFSTFSNLLRHQREKSGTASKSYCPKCGAEFTRTTARNGHLQHEKCTKQRKSSTESR